MKPRLKPRPLSRRQSATFIVSLLATLGYCFLVWFAIGFYTALLPDMAWENLPRISRIASQALFAPPWHAIHWQLLALGSWGIAVWLDRRNHIGQKSGERIWLIHSYVLLGLMLWNALGLLIPFVPAAWVLAPVP